MKTFELDIYPEYFKAVSMRIKNFEIRRDINCEPGDKLILKEYDPDTQNYTGNVITRVVTYLTSYAQIEGYVVIGIC